MSQVKVTTQAPEGVRIKVHVSATPKTVEKFVAIVEAAGGPGAFRRGSSSAIANILFCDLSSETMLLVDCSELEPRLPRPTPFLDAFEERIKAARE